MWLIRVLQYLTKLINQGEDTAITFISTIVPWVVPVVPAYLTFEHSINPKELALPAWVAFCVGVTVESLGLTSMYRTFQYMNHNRKYKDATKKSPTWIPILTYVFYLVVVLTVNVVLDTKQGVDGSHVLAIALLSVLSVPAGVLISVQAVHTERVAEHQNELAERRTKAEQARANQNVLKRSPEPKPEPERSRVPASQRQNEILAILEREFEAGRPAPRVRDIISEAQLHPDKDKGYVSTLRKHWATTRGVTLEK